MSSFKNCIVNNSYNVINKTRLILGKPKEILTYKRARNITMKLFQQLA